MWEIHTFSDIRNWLFSDIRKLFSDIRNKFLKFQKLISDIRKSFSDIRKSALKSYLASYSLKAGDITRGERHGVAKASWLTVQVITAAENPSFIIFYPIS